MHQPATRSSQTEIESASTLTPRRATAIVVIVSALVYLPVLWTGFVGDDYFILVRLQTLGGLSRPLEYFRTGFFEYYRPFGFLSHALDWNIWGRTAAGYHLTSLLLHAASAVLVFVLARRLMSTVGAFVAALLFAWHPAAHEAVYWMAARFDLLATVLTLATVLLATSERSSTRALAIATYALALLSKESALACPVIVLGYEALIRRSSWRAALERVAPLAISMVIYLALRSQATELPASELRRLPKLVTLAAAMLSGFVLTWPRARRAMAELTRWRLGMVLALPVALAATGLAVPLTRAWMCERLGFVAYTSFYLLSPIVLPSPPGNFFTPFTVKDALPGLMALGALSGLAWLGRRIIATHRAVQFALFATGASLIPVMSLTGSPRYVYMATAGAAMLAGYACTAPALERRARRRLGVTLSVASIIGLIQLGLAAAAWRDTSRMVRDGIALMSRDLQPCGTKPILMLTAPVGIKSIYSNFYWDMFAFDGCTPSSLSALLRLARYESTVTPRDLGDGRVELRLHAYRGNAVASADLRHFDRNVAPGDAFALETSVGRLTTHADGADQVFVIALNADASRGPLFYYSDGQMWPLTGKPNDETGVR